VGEDEEEKRASASEPNKVTSEWLHSEDGTAMEAVRIMYAPFHRRNKTLRDGGRKGCTLGQMNHKLREY
jgi:hypothetical protein